MSEARLFDPDVLNRPVECWYPQLKGTTGYRYGCRCARCVAGKAGEGRRVLSSVCATDGCANLRHKHRRHCLACRPLRACRYPGCSEPARSVQGARYCDEHATSIGYVLTGREPFAERRCVGCDQTFAAVRGKWSETSLTWHEFCGECRVLSPLSLTRLRAHHVPAETIRAWLRCGDRLPCAVCGTRLSRRSASASPVIDHDHTCCPGGTSCGACIRGVTCQPCNTMVGYFEAMRRRDLFDAVAAYVNGAAA